MAFDLDNLHRPSPCFCRLGTLLPSTRSSTPGTLRRRTARRCVSAGLRLLCPFHLPSFRRVPVWTAWPWLGIERAATRIRDGLRPQLLGSRLMRPCLVECMHPLGQEGLL